MRHVIGAVDLAHPSDADTAQGLGNRVVRRLAGILRARGQDILSPRRGGIVIVHHHRHGIGLVEGHIAETAGQPVVPKPTIADHRDGPFAPAARAPAVKGPVRGRTKPISHGRAADVEGRQAGKQMTADIGADLVFAQFLLHQLHRGKNWPLRATGAKPRRADRHGLRQVRNGRWRFVRGKHLCGQHGGGGLT